MIKVNFEIKFFPSVVFPEGNSNSHGTFGRYEKLKSYQSLFFYKVVVSSVKWPIFDPMAPCPPSPVRDDGRARTYYDGSGPPQTQIEKVLNVLESGSLTVEELLPQIEFST